MARTSRARATAPALRRALDRLLSAEGVPCSSVSRLRLGAVPASLSHARTAATHYGAERGILVSLVAELTGLVRPGLLPS